MQGLLEIFFVFFYMVDFGVVYWIVLICWRWLGV